MAIHTSSSRKIFLIFDYTFLGLLSLLCLLPLVHELAVSFSAGSAASANVVLFWPVKFTTASYSFVSSQSQFVISLLITLKRVFLGTLVNMILTVLVAYPLSKERKDFRMRSAYTWFFLITILFSGGLIPWYMTIKQTHLLDTIWALIIPGAVPVFNVILLMNFFRALPKEIEEAAFIDGASHLTALVKIYLPLSLPALATLVLFAVVNHWNSWFDGLILMNSPKHYPLQSYLQTVIITRNLSTLTPDNALFLSVVSDRTQKAAQVFLGAIPILMVYPFLQKYFMTGIVMGSVKG